MYQNIHFASLVHVTSHVLLSAVLRLGGLGRGYEKIHNLHVTSIKLLLAFIVIWGNDFDSFNCIVSAHAYAEKRKLY